MNPETGAIEKELEVPAEAGTAFDGEHLYRSAKTRIRKVDPGPAAWSRRSKRRA